MVFNVTESEHLTVVEDYPHEVVKHEHVWIPLSDGKRLAATIWMPKDAEENPVPVILEYLPYRKDDFTAIRDSIRHPYFAGHGYASMRVDIRGAGNSDGILKDEYLKQEQDDALEIFDWIEQQKWSTGSVGMIGKSWGGFNGLQVAARNHPALKTIITLCSTDDRFSDDVHYRGGNVLASDMLWWASTMFAYSARPQDPEVVGEGWKENWLERLNTEPYVNTWMSHQVRDAYWKHGSVNEDYSKLNIPIFAVSGWEDSYKDAVFRLVENAPFAKGLIGPWSHEYPEVATPEPSIGFLQESLRWWDQWLKGIDRGITEEPAIKFWMQDSMKPQVNYDERPGKWIAEPSWPSPNVKETKMWVEDDGLSMTPSSTKQINIPSVQEHGMYAGVFCPFGEPGDLPSDQRLENGTSVLFTSQPFEEDMEILGNPTFDMTFTSDQENALVALRLCVKAPTGESTMISWGMLNLNHLTSHEFPEKLIPGEEYQATVKLNSIGQKIPAGHRLELAISPTYWPQAWPSPKPVTLHIHTGEETTLNLPVRVQESGLDHLVAFEKPEIAPVIDREVIREETRTRTISHQTITDEWKLEDYSDEGERLLPHNGISHGSKNKNTFRITAGDPLSANITCEWEMVVGRKGWETKIFTFSEMTSDLENFYLTNKITAYYNDKKEFTRTWHKEIPRNFQ